MTVVIQPDNSSDERREIFTYSLKNQHLIRQRGGAAMSDIGSTRQEDIDENHVELFKLDVRI